MQQSWKAGLYFTAHLSCASSWGYAQLQLDPIDKTCLDLNLFFVCKD